MKKLFLLMLAMATLFLTACGGKETSETETAATEETLNVGIVLSVGGLGDKSFNDSAYRGLEMAQEELGINFRYVEPASPAEDEQYLREFAENDFDLIVGVGFLMKDALAQVAADFPEVKFALIDETVELPNVSSLLFAEDEGSFLVGALAAMMSETGAVGFVGGMEVPLIQKFQRGFENGAKYVNEDIKSLVLYTSGPNPFNDPVRGKENALSLIKQGADVVYHAAGGTGVGVIAAAKQAGVWAIGVDSNQDAVEEGTVLTSMVKNVDIAVYNTVKDTLAGEFKPGINVLGVAEGGVGTSDFEFTREAIGEEKLAELEVIKEKIINGEIKF